MLDFGKQVRTGGGQSDGSAGRSRTHFDRYTEGQGYDQELNNVVLG
jgi:hypothetical protein